MTYHTAQLQTGTVLIEFYATWCPHCRRMIPVIKQLKELLNGQAEIYQFDIDADSDAANEAGVESVPTFIIYRNGREMWRHSGEIEGEVLLGKVESVLNGY